MDPVLGPALGRVPEMSVSSVAVLCVATVGSLTSMPVSVRSHRRPIPDAGSGGFWWRWWQQVVAGIRLWMTKRTFIRLRSGRLQRARLRPLQGGGP